ncbi:hypothetical protein Pen02_80210 [Plantactinospora endophytica]|uniref:Uncharacterized protein n=1 Tax=Plantactinospora endophytica TaxID=673535 RepID=A0ABQ4EEC5_9ACTN|nr:hypothetical protein Pen02_80210 [Plantactinospora endophytica]
MNTAAARRAPATSTAPFTGPVRTAVPGRPPVGGSVPATAPGGEAVPGNRCDLDGSDRRPYRPVPAAGSAVRSGAAPVTETEE